MSVVAQFTLPAEQFVLGEVLEVGDGPEIRLESMIPTGDSVVPYFWVPTESAAPVREALESSPLVEEVAIVDDAQPESLFRVTWAEEVNGLLDHIRNSDAALLEAHGLGDDWTFRMRFPEREALSEFYRTCTESGLTLELEEVNNPIESPRNTGFGLSEAQREFLLVALEKGYFDVPRRVNLTELADELGISGTAASQRLRRGLTTLLTAALQRRTRPRHSEADE